MFRPTSAELLLAIAIETTTGKLLHLIGEGNYENTELLKQPLAVFSSWKSSQPLSTYVASCQGMPPKKKEVQEKKKKKKLEEAILPNAQVVDLLHILSDKQPQRVLFLFVCFFLFPSSRLLNHSQHLNILLSSSPPTCYDKECCNVRKDAHSSQCTHRSPRGRLGRRARVCDKRERGRETNGERWGQHQKVWQKLKCMGRSLCRCDN